MLRCFTSKDPCILPLITSRSEVLCMAECFFIPLLKTHQRNGRRRLMNTTDVFINKPEKFLAFSIAIFPVVSSFFLFLTFKITLSIVNFIFLFFVLDFSCGSISYLKPRMLERHLGLFSTHKQSVYKKLAYHKHFIWKYQRFISFLFLILDLSFPSGFNKSNFLLVGNGGRAGKKNDLTHFPLFFFVFVFSFNF